MTTFTFSRFIYFDTNIISHYVKDKSLWPKLFEYLSVNGLTLGLGEGQVSELSDLKSLHKDLARLLVSIPTGIIKGWNQILKEEVDAHPDERKKTLLSYPLNAILNEDNGFENLIHFFASKKLSKARKGQIKSAKQMGSRHNKLKSNFPPSTTGKYIADQADEFAQIQVMQWLASEHNSFLAKFRSDVSGLNTHIFLSVRLYAYVIFYKYYLGQRQPENLSDFGDLFHLFSLPYCEIAVMERDLCNVLNQIKRKYDVLDKTEVQNIEFIHSIHD